MSGLMRPSGVGPKELKEASCSKGESWEGRGMKDTLPPSLDASHNNLSCVQHKNVYVCWLFGI